MQSRAPEAGLDDAILVNTCAVTAEAVRQARQAIRKARREHPRRRSSSPAAPRRPSRRNLPPCRRSISSSATRRSSTRSRIGDWMEERTAPTASATTLMSSLPGLTRQPSPAPPNTPSTVPEWMPGSSPGMTTLETVRGLYPRPSPTSASRLQRKSASATSLPCARPPRISSTALPRPTRSGNERARAFVQVQNGCDHRCTFCVIPYGRGNSRSVPMGAVVDAVRRLAEHGVARNRADRRRHHRLRRRPSRPPEARRAGARNPEACAGASAPAPHLDRFRRGRRRSPSRASREEERLMPHLHLSLQSGDDMILKRMKRRHCRADAIRFCERVRAPPPRHRARRGSDRRLPRPRPTRCFKTRCRSSTIAG